MCAFLVFPFYTPHIDKITNTMIYNQVLGSDHCPIGIDIDLKYKLTGIEIAKQIREKNKNCYIFLLCFGI